MKNPEPITPDFCNLFSAEEWEALCDRCGTCCLYKIEDGDSGELFYTRLLCTFLDKTNRSCSVYPERFSMMPTCVSISAGNLPNVYQWLPKHCAYRCLIEGWRLPDWHPLNTSVTAESQQLLKKIGGFCQCPNPSKISRSKLEKLIQRAINTIVDDTFDEKLILNVIDNLEI